jgi:hypothetical protein
MARPEDIEKFKEQAEAVQTVPVEVNDFAAAFEYAADLTLKQGGRNIAAPAITGKNLCRGLGVTKEPRELLDKAGLEYVESKDEAVCCGFGGSFSMDFPEISAELLKRKLNCAESTGAEVLVTDCPGCVLQLRGGMKKRGGRMQVKHIAEIVAGQLKE